MADRRDEMRIERHVARPARACVVFFVDGMSPTVLHRLIAAGRLPEIERRFVRGGTEVTDTWSCLPSVTYANVPSLLTGCRPHRHGLTGVRWLDSATLESADYSSPLTYRHADRDMFQPTLYERLAHAETLNVQCHTRRGATHTIDQDISTGLFWFLGRFMAVDARVGGVLPRIGRRINRAGRWPLVWMNYFPGVDEIGHRHGPDSAEYAEALENVDRTIARIASAAEAAAGDTSLCFALITDHGMVPISRRVSLFPLLSTEFEAGGRPPRIALRVPRMADPARRAAWLDRHDMVLLIESDRSARAYLRPESGWRASSMPANEASYRPDLEAIASCADWFMRLPGVSFISFRTPSGVEVRRSRSWASNHREGSDSSGLVLPEFSLRMEELFRSNRAGDLLILADDQTSFTNAYRGGHGSCLRADAAVSHFYAGPTIPRGARIRSASVVDFCPTVLDLVGELREPDSKEMCGISLLPRLLAGNRAADLR